MHGPRICLSESAQLIVVILRQLSITTVPVDGDCALLIVDVGEPAWTLESFQRRTGCESAGCGHNGVNRSCPGRVCVAGCRCEDLRGLRLWAPRLQLLDLTGCMSLSRVGAGGRARGHAAEVV